MNYKRVQGGEKNIKSGKRWTKDEIIKVYHLYKKLHGKGLHEHNPEIQKLAKELGRTIRSTEAQTLMFRNLDKSGNYSHGNMNKISRQIWLEYESFNTKNQLELFKINKNDNVLTGKEPLEQKNEIIDSFNEEFDFDTYKDWNKRIIEHFFHEGLEDKEVVCFLIFKELFEKISDNKHCFLDFENAIEKELGSKTFEQKFHELYLNSIPNLFGGRRLRKEVPEYFGVLIYLIYSLTEAEGTNLRISNVYDRINDVGSKRFNDKWGKVDSKFAREVLERVWEDLEDWSVNFKKGKLGFFKRYDPKNKQRKYVSRIERHALFNSGHFQQLFDLLIEEGIVPKQYISLNGWIRIFEKGRSRIGNSDKILDYLRDASVLSETTLKFINEYYYKNYSDSLISSDSGSVRKPSIPLLLCLNELPEWDDLVDVKDIHFRGFSSELGDDIVNYLDSEYSIEHEHKNYSRKVALNWDPEKGETNIINGIVQRYAIQPGFKWLLFNRELEEWIEVLKPENALDFIVLVDENQMNLIYKEIETEKEIYNSPWTNYKFILFNALTDGEFEQLLDLLGYKERIEGAINIESEFLINRGRTVLKEFNCKFRYSGPIGSPELYGRYIDESESWKLTKEVEESGTSFLLPEEILLSRNFIVYEAQSKVRSHFSYSLGQIENSPIINIEPPKLKDPDGKAFLDREISDDDIFDVPSNFNRENINNTEFNTWHMKLWSIFKPKHKDYITRNDQVFSYDEKHNGENLLRFLSITNSIDTYKFCALIREISPTISSQFGKRIMIYWRELGYINFSTFGGYIKVNPTALFFLETEKGLKAFLTGYRNKDIISKLASVCKELNLIVKKTRHSEEYHDVFPYRIEIYDKLGDLEKFKSLANKVNIEYINNIENPLNRKFSVYQLACFYTQRSVSELDLYLASKPIYPNDHHRKLVFNSTNCNWNETTKNINSMDNAVLVRYDGFKDRQMIHVYKDDSGVRKLDDFSLCSFKIIEDNVFLRKRHRVKDVSDFYVPLYMSLPFWIERGLMLINARIPIVENNNNKTYRVYKNIHDSIIELIENKLDQTSIIIS